MDCEEYDEALKRLGVNPNPMCPVQQDGKLGGYHKMGEATVLVFSGDQLTPEQRKAQIRHLESRKVHSETTSR